MTLTQNLKHKAIEGGFVSAGVPSPDMLRSLFYGWVGKIASMRSSVEILPTAESRVLMDFSGWDNTAFSLAVDPRIRLE